MFDILVNAGTIILSNIVQIVAGCMISILIFYLFSLCSSKTNTRFLHEGVLIVFFSLLGVILPLDIYGMIPVFAALISVGFKVYEVLPLLISNTIFNMLVPFYDPSFIWRTGIKKVILALAIGIAAGFIMKICKFKANNMLMHSSLSCIPSSCSFLKASAMLTYKYINSAGLYLIFGVILNQFFQQTIVSPLVRLGVGTVYTSLTPSFAAALNVVNPIFLLAMGLVYVILDLVKLSALFPILKPKGLIFYYGNLAVWAFLLGLFIFF